MTHSHQIRAFFCDTMWIFSWKVFFTSVNFIFTVFLNDFFLLLITGGMWRNDKSTLFDYTNIQCKPKIFHVNISHQLFDYKITFENSQQENTNSKGDFKDFWYTKKI